MDANTRVHIPMHTDPEEVNKIILSVASPGTTVRIMVDYENQGDDLVDVHPDGTIEVVEDGS